MIRETRLWERALKERWPIPDAMRGVIVKTLAKILIDPEASAREKTAAARALMHADQQNIEMEKMHQADEHEQRARLVEIAKHIGFSEVASLASTAGINLEIEESIILDSQSDKRGENGRVSTQETSQSARHQDLSAGKSFEED